LRRGGPVAGMISSVRRFALALLLLAGTMILRIAEVPAGSRLWSMRTVGA
jgi:hypothetical protein